MKSDLEKILNKTKVKGLTDSESNFLWSNISENLSVERQGVNNYNKFYMKPSIKKVRFIVASALVASLFGGSFATVALADNSRPGDFLFPIDLASENFQLKFSSDKKRGDLHIKFASERLDEVRQLLALVVLDDNAQLFLSATTTSTTTDSTETGTTTATTTEDTQDDENSTSPDAVTQTNSALLVALEYLENSRIVLEAEGNEIGVMAIDAFIAELTELASSQVDSIEKSKIKIRGNSGNVKIEIEASIDDVKTKFKFENKNGKKGGQKIELKSGDEKMKLDIKGDEISFKFDSGKSEKGNKKDDKKITICHEGDDTTSVKSKDLSKHISHGDTLGRCDNDDDEDDDEDGDHDDDDEGKYDKKLYICHKGKTTIHVSKNSLWAHLRHGDDTGKCGGEDDDDDTATTTPDTVSPIITNLSTNSTTTEAEISWNTDEDSDSTVWFGTSTPLSLDQNNKVEESTMTSAHSLDITGLTASTTYYYVASSADSSGNTATTSEGSFVTTAEQEQDDTTPPVVSNVSSVAATTSAEVSFDTDEDSTAVVWYGTTTPLVLDGNTDEVLLSTLDTSHSADLLTLASSTDYYFVIVATDEFGNIATTSEESFTTLTPIVADTTAPEIANISSVATTTSAVVTFETNEDATSVVWYGTTSPISVGTTTLSSLNNTLTSSHSIGLLSLTASTTYYYIIEAVDEALNSFISSEETFTTL